MKRIKDIALFVLMMPPLCVVVSPIGFGAFSGIGLYYAGLPIWTCVILGISIMVTYAIIIHHFTDPKCENCSNSRMKMEELANTEMTAHSLDAGTMQFVEHKWHCKKCGTTKIL